MGTTGVVIVGGCASGDAGLGGVVSYAAVYDTLLSADTMYQHATTNPIPEPSTLVLLAAGLAGLLAYAWRRRR